MTACYLPEIFVPIVGLFFPIITMASIFLYIESSREINFQW